MRRFAISDIHGCAHTFRKLLAALDFSLDDQLFLLGDLIDRGPDTKGLLDTIFQLQANGYHIEALRGNHEAAMIRAWSTASAEREWKIKYGGAEVLASFGAKHIREIPTQYLLFLSSMPYYLQPKGYVLVHGGVNFSTENPLENLASLLTLRDWYGTIRREWLGNRYILHGHTPISKEAIETQLTHFEAIRALNLDAGCVYAHKNGRGWLCAFDMDAHTLHFERREETTLYGD